ncbi:MAG: N-acetylmuramoyl-L-alanine amidase [Saprospiraceae bacterium]|nr:N-acetylmuramoyl-L-alanine amidase [Saprospiraceae bacterium]
MRKTRMIWWSATPHSMNFWTLKHMVTAIILIQTFFFSWAQPSALAFNTFSGTNNPTVPKASQVIQVHKGIKTDPHDKAGYKVKTIVIDAGHGGHDPGCLGGNSREKHLALGIALKLRTLLRKSHPDINIIMTRDDDTFIPLYKRAAIANRNQADLFISIHCNFMPGSTATRGSETYVMGLHTAKHNLQVAKRENASILLEDDYEKNYDYDPNSPEGHIILSMFQNAYLEQSILFAESVENQLKVKAERRSRGVKQAGFVVLKETTMPSILIEAGFLSNATEEKFLMSEPGQEKVARAIQAAFAEYLTILQEEPSEHIAQISQQEVPTKDSTISEIEEKSISLKAIAAAMPPPTTEDKVDKKTSTQSRKVYSNVYQPRTSVVKEQAIDHKKLRSQGPVPMATTKKDQPTPLQKQTAEPQTNNKPVQFFVQLAASKQPQATTDPKWRNLPYSIQVFQEDNLFKYRARHFASLDDAVRAKQYLRQHGFPEAFVIAISGGQRISIEKARSMKNIR